MSDNEYPEPDEIQAAAGGVPDDYEYCPICGAVLEWEDCWNGCDDGYFDGYEDDPLWYDPGDLIVCSVCGGRGGYLACPDVESHAKIVAEDKAAKA